MRKGKKDIFFRMDENEFNDLQIHFSDFDSMGDFFINAAREFSNKDVSQIIKAEEELALFYKKYSNELSHLGGNLNQYVRHLNELAIIDKVNYNDIISLKPILENIKAFLSTLSNELFLITKKVSL